jgi:Lon protease-like protein
MKPKHLTLPMMPLPLMLLPDETTRLYIFEERYRQMIDDCIRNGASFGIPYTEKNKIQKYGCEVKILRIVKRYDNGAFDILIECKGLFQVNEFSERLRPKLYGAAQVQFLNTKAKILLNNLQDATVNYFSTVQNKIIDYDTVSRLTVYSVASALQLTHAEKYRLVGAPNQQMHLLNMLNFIIHIINAEQRLKDRFIEN